MPERRAAVPRRQVQQIFDQLQTDARRRVEDREWVGRRRHLGCRKCAHESERLQRLLKPARRSIPSTLRRRRRPPQRRRLQKIESQIDTGSPALIESAAKPCAVERCCLSIGEAQAHGPVCNAHIEGRQIFVADGVGTIQDHAHAVSLRRNRRQRRCCSCTLHLSTHPISLSAA